MAGTETEMRIREKTWSKNKRSAMFAAETEIYADFEMRN